MKLTTQTQVTVDVFGSRALPAHGDRLGAFEGPGHSRDAVDVSTAEGALPAWIYVLADAISATSGLR